jgi:nitroreductase
MTSLYDLLLSRRTIRAFRPDAIPAETMNKLILAAKYAPTAMGLQDRHFTVVNDPAVMDEIVAAAVKNGAGFVPGHTPFYDAPSLVIVSAPEHSKYNRENAACAIENLLLAACSFGLGSCYICSVLPGLRDEDVRKKLRIPAGYVPFGCVSLGYPAQEAPEPKSRRDDDVTMIP